MIQIDFQSLILGMAAIVLLIALVVALIKISWKGILINLVLAVIIGVILLCIVKSINGEFSVDSLPVALSRGEFSVVCALLFFALLIARGGVILGILLAAAVLYYGGSYALSFVSWCAVEFPNLTAIAGLALAIFFALAIMGNARAYASTKA